MYGCLTLCPVQQAQAYPLLHRELNTSREMAYLLLRENMRDDIMFLLYNCNYKKKKHQCYNSYFYLILVMFINLIMVVESILHSFWIIL